MNNVEEKEKNSIKDLPRNIWAVGLTSFFMDVSSEMVINILPLFLSNVLGVKTNIIGLIEGVAESTASILKLFFGLAFGQTACPQMVSGGGLWSVCAIQTIFLFCQYLGVGGRRALGGSRGQRHSYCSA